MPNISRKTQLNIRLSEAENIAIRRAAHAMGLAPSVYVRMLAVTAAATHTRKAALAPKEAQQ